MRTRFLLGVALMLTIGIWVEPAALWASPARVALMDFSTDDNSYRSAQAAADFSSVLQAELNGIPGVEWVERAQLDRAREELELSSMELLSGVSSIRWGKWVKADWMVTGSFSLDDRNRRTLFMEATDLKHADVLASQTLVLTNSDALQVQVDKNRVGYVANALRKLLLAARLRESEMTGKILVAPLFLAEEAGGGSNFGHSRNTGTLEQGFLQALKRIAATNAQVRLIRFPKTYRSLEESELVLDGLAEANRDAWKQAADLYVWGTYHVERESRRLPLQQEIKIRVSVWDGVSPPAVLDDQIPCTFSGFAADEAAVVLERLARSAMARARKHPPQTDGSTVRTRDCQVPCANLRPDDPDRAPRSRSSESN